MAELVVKNEGQKDEYKYILLKHALDKGMKREGTSKFAGSSVLRTKRAEHGLRVKPDEM